MSHQNSEIRNELVDHFNAAFDYAGGCTQHGREAAHYQCGRKEGIGQALELVDTFLRSEEGQPARRRPVAEIIAAVEAVRRGRAAALVTDPDHVRA
jgi:hypothetical protein